MFIAFLETPISALILVITIGISLYSLFKDETLIDKLILHPYSVVRKREYYRIITSGLIHADLWHLAFNMLSFQSFAFYLERQLGSIPFLLLYLVCLVTSDITTILKNRDNAMYRSLGASGAVSGVIFSFILFFPGIEIGILFIPFGIPATVFGILFLLYSYYSANYQYDNINHDAHLWGALTGFALTVVYEPSLLPNLLSYFSSYGR
ncbi:MAG: rhomboid family intramembrane serine protease [Leptospiraceae bacterium]|nr:rhomboid family intramembrane serine protease [Leptospiraceae bacterium]MCP5494148.1 rhomboid family intramembrane serine protease [Leptospiraceae bacterium]